MEFRFKSPMMECSDFSKIEGVVFFKGRKFLERFYVSGFFDCLSRKVKYLIGTKVNYSRKTRPVRREKDSILWNVQFTHSIIGDLNLNSILGSAEVARNLPSDIKKKFDIRPWYRYGKTIGSKILNYNKRLKNCGNLSYSVHEL